MFAIFCKRRLIVPRTDSCIFAAQQIWAQEKPVFVRSCSTSVCENVSERTTFNVSSYLIESCGLSSKRAVSVSQRLRGIKSPQKPDAVLKLLREYGFTDALHIPRIVTAWPAVLLASPNETLLPKLQFLRSIGIPHPVLAHKVSVFPSVLKRSLEKSIVPLYNHLKSLLGSDKIVALVFARAPRIFGDCLIEVINRNISMLRERGMPEHNVVSLFRSQPTLMAREKEKLDAHVDRALVMGFDISKKDFINAIRVFAGMTESTLRQKMEIYRRCGWTEPEIDVAFLREPLCMTLSEKKITSTMDFLVNTWGCKPAAVAQCPVLLSFSLEKRIKPRWMVARILNNKGLMKNMHSVSTLLIMTEEKFLERYVVIYEKDIPELLDIYLGKVEYPQYRKNINALV